MNCKVSTDDGLLDANICFPCQTSYYKHMNECINSAADDSLDETKVRLDIDEQGIPVSMVNPTIFGSSGRGPKVYRMHLFCTSDAFDAYVEDVKEKINACHSIDELIVAAPKRIVKRKVPETNIGAELAKVRLSKVYVMHCK